MAQGQKKFKAFKWKLSTNRPDLELSKPFNWIYQSVTLWATLTFSSRTYCIFNSCYESTLLINGYAELYKNKYTWMQFYQTKVLSVNTQDLKYFLYCFHREDDQILTLQLEFQTWNHVIFIYCDNFSVTGKLMKTAKPISPKPNKLTRKRSRLSWYNLTFPMTPLIDHYFVSMKVEVEK